jgi:ATP-dependent RNA helicase DeaD
MNLDSNNNLDLEQNSENLDVISSLKAFEQKASNSSNTMSSEDAQKELETLSAYDAIESFDNLGLSEEVLRAIKDLGYEAPSPIQAKSIGPILDGNDILGQAQTGTGKTAAFALPLLSKIQSSLKTPQVLILAPTRELAIQCAEACQSFAKYLPKFNVLPIYGGASYDIQIKSLNRGVQLVVGTPGRVMDLIKKDKLKLNNLKTLVLDEADEMLRMGFIEDVEWIIEQCPEERQIALFSATMPEPIKRVARKYLNSPVEIKIPSKTQTANTVRQRYWMVSGLHKIDALTRLLEVEPYDALLIFTRTKTDAEDLAIKLAARGHACEALHGDIPQKIREKIVDKLRNGQLDVLIATDVVARGLDVDRITHVVNFDIPYDPESYVHRIGRTGRAGRTGDAILFVSPKERRMLRLIEHTTKQPIEPMKMPTNQDINRHRLQAFKNKILMSLESDDLEPYEELINEILVDDSIEPIDLCVALAKLVQGDQPLFVDETIPEPKQSSFDDVSSKERSKKNLPSAEAEPLKDFPDIKMVRYRIAVGRRDGVKPGSIVGAVANEGNIDSQYIGCINIYDSFSTIDLPDQMPKETLDILKKSRVCGRALEIRVYYDDKTAQDKSFARMKDSSDRRGKGGYRGRDNFSKNKSSKDERSSKKSRDKKTGRSKLVFS